MSRKRGEEGQGSRRGRIGRGEYERYTVESGFIQTDGGEEVQKSFQNASFVVRGDLAYSLYNQN